MDIIGKKEKKDERGGEGRGRGIEGGGVNVTYTTKNDICHPTNITYTIYHIHSFIHSKI
jgi:hypothetical protein